MKMIQNSARLFICATGRLGRRMLASIALTDAGRLAAQSAQEVELGATDAAVLDDIDMIDDCRMKRKDALNPNAKRRLAYGDRLTDAFAAARDHDAFKGLQPLLGLTLLDSHMNANGVAGNEFRDVTLQLRLFYIIQFIHFITSLFIYLKTIAKPIGHHQG